MTKTPLILDTNIVSRVMLKSSQKAFTEEINRLLEHYTLLVTLFTQYELLKSSDRDNEKLILKYLSDNYPRIVLNETAINFSARIFNLYKKHPTTKGLKLPTETLLMLPSL